MKVLRFIVDLAWVIAVGIYDDWRAVRRELRSDVRTVIRGEP